MPRQCKHRDLRFPHAAEVSLVLELEEDLPGGLCSVHFLNRTLAIFRLTRAHRYFSIYRRQSNGIKQKKLYKGMP